MMKTFENSSNIASAEHDGNDLTVEFRDGRRYIYSDVPSNVAQELFEQESPGTYLAANIKGFYLFNEVKGIMQPTATGPSQDVTDNVEALLTAALKATEKLPQSRPKALVSTKIDEALLWLTRIK